MINSLKFLMKWRIQIIGRNFKRHRLKAKTSRKMKNTKELRTWLDDMNLEHPLVIAGPCSAETEEQVLKIAHELKDSDVSYFRAGIWKPRTRPGMFEGVGEIGLRWLKKVKEETGMKTCTEVANAAHVKLALEHDIDLLWIGARSTVSPFIVQEIADALEGTDKIVLVKNPVNPDLALWLGGIERLYSANIKNLLQYKNELSLMRNQSIDVTNFENKINSFNFQTYH